ncbi:MAG: hypothetical protein E3J94_03440 [Desulfobacteraceae bacterium]|nr:MAG: hypothetical protein E3J94_03440 [Desulfobacteraceae bacterium]
MRLRNKIIVASLVFCLTYLLFLILWIQVKPYYGNIITQVGARLAASTTGLRVEQIRHGKEVATITFARTVLTKKGLGDILLDLKIRVSNYSFNVPLTLALVAGLFPFFKWRKRSLIEACFILLFIHLLYIYFFCTLQVVHQLTLVGMKAPLKTVLFLLQFMWVFTDNMVIRFEPFLVAVYLWLRNTKHPAH